MTKLYLIRHGETDLNTSGVLYGWTDCGLNIRGIGQSKDLSRALSDVNFDIVITSPLKRAIDTASIVSGWASERIVIDKRLKEFNFGNWEGKHYQEIKSRDKEKWDLWVKDWKNICPPSGESFLEFYQRVKNSIDHILEKYDKRTIMLVSHQGCLRLIMCILLNMDCEKYYHFTFEQGTYSLLYTSKEYCVVKKINQKP
ncbi:MAG: alpha-ribazole phosphatase [Bacillota bacterium]|jgi:alpha-ribazole phosphatase